MNPDYTLVSFLLQYLPPFITKIGVLGGRPPHTTPFTLIRGIEGYILSAMDIFLCCDINNIKALKARI